MSDLVRNSEGSPREREPAPARSASTGFLVLLAFVAVTACLVGLLVANAMVRDLTRQLDTYQADAQEATKGYEALTEAFGALRRDAVSLADAVEAALGDEVAVDVGEVVVPGMNYCDWRGQYGSDASHKMVQRLADIGIRKLVLTPTYYQRTAQSTEIYADRRDSQNAKTPTRAQLESDIRLAHGLGMEVGLKLHIDPEDKTPRGEIRLRNEQDFHKWLGNYCKILNEMVDVAKASQVEHFYVGCELSRVAVHPYTEEWRKIIRGVRERFLPHKPKLTFASQHTNTYNIQFWDDLDYIGINTWPYFPSSPKLSVPSLKAKWKSVTYMVRDTEVDFFDYVRFVARVFGKPVVLTEFGCQSKTGAASRSVVWDDEGEPAPLVQAYYYEAFFAALREDMAQFAQTHPSETYPIVGVDSWNCVLDGAGPGNADYTIVGKPAEMLYRKMFAGHKSHNLSLQ